LKKRSGNKNIKKKILSVLLYIFITIAFIPPVLTLFFQNSAVQTISARFAADFVSKKINQRVSIDRLRIGFLTGINLHQLVVSDHHNNSLLGIGSLSAIPIFTNFSFTEIKFLSINIDSAQFNMGSYKDENSDNLSMLIQKISRDGNNSGGGTFGLFSDKVKMTNSSFNLFNQNRDYESSEKTMDYADIHIKEINMELSDFKMLNDSLNINIEKLSAVEKCGLVVKKLSTNFILSSKGLFTNNAKIEINNSVIDVDFAMHYSSYGSMSYYIDSVIMTGNIHPTIVDMADIGYFADILFEMPNIVGITGMLNGTVSDLKGNDLRFKYGENTRVSGDISFKGLPDFFSSHIVGTNLRVTSNPHDISTFHLPIEGKHIEVPNILAPKEQITIIGDFNGYYEDFTSDLEIIMEQGEIQSKIDFKNDPEQFIIVTSLLADSINIGKLLNQEDILEKASFQVDISIGGKSLNELAYSASGIITNADILNYNYKRIGIDGSYIGDSVIANIRVGDKNLMMNSSFNMLLTEIPYITLKTEITKANLNKLHLWNDQNISISTVSSAKVTGTDIETLSAEILFTSSKFQFEKNEYTFDSILIAKHTDTSNVTSTILISDFSKLKATGNYNLNTLVHSTLSLADHYFDIIPEHDTSRLINDENITLDISFPEPKIITNEFLRGVNISPNTSIHAAFDFKDFNTEIFMVSDWIMTNGVKFDTSKLNITSKNDHLLTEFSIANIILKDSTPEDSIVFGLDDFSVSAILGNDSIIYGVNWENQNQKLKNSGILEGFISKIGDSTKFSIGKANVFINDIMWDIDSNNMVIRYDDRTFFKNFFIHADSSEFKLIGTIPKDENDSLIAEFKDWRLSNFDIITKPMNIDLDGEINGMLKLSMRQNNPTLVSNIEIIDLGLNNEYLGDANIINSWDNTSNSIFIKSQIIRKGNVGSGEVFKADGYYYPTKIEDNLNIDVSFNRFKLKTFEPFLNSFVTELEGNTSGKLSIKGSVDKPIITGFADMQRTGLRVVYLNTKYSFSNSIDFVKNGIKFDKLEIYDTLGNSAQIDGSLTHSFFNDPKFDIDITTPELLFFNTSEHMNDLYYGSAVASGKIKISGTPEDVDLSIDVKTQKGTSVILPLNYSVEISDKDYIIFKQKDSDSIPDDKLIDIVSKNNKNELSYNIDVKMEVTPNAQVGITLPEDMGTIEARGKSNLAVDVNSNGKFSLVGDYIVEDGLFQFKIGNLVSKRFSLVKNGRISWSGNPYSANVSIKGLYKVKTSLANLGIQIDSTTSFKNKVTVECYVVLTGELLNPNIKFEIKIPNLDPDYQRIVFSELDTTNTAMMNQQMISLLVLGTFSFNNAANVSLQSSYYNVIANQLSSMLSQISDNVDIGLNYKPGDNVSQEEFEVALSTQLFDDRLTIDGNFGMTYDRTEQSASNIVGDVDIGYKLTPDGQWVLKVFNHSNVSSWYNYSNYDQISPYTQGVGIAFRKDFNNISELFAGKKKRNKKESKDKQENQSANKEDEEVGKDSPD
jgi:translocation-and-assembly-module (TAM) inner membrane subunit TamB-like protein